MLCSEEVDPNAVKQNDQQGMLSNITWLIPSIVLWHV